MNAKQVVDKRISMSWEKHLQKEPIELLCIFETQAKLEGWDDASILKVLLEAVKNENKHLLKTLAIHSDICGR